MNSPLQSVTMHRATTILLALPIILSPVLAQQAADGLIVPFASLPSCASLCGNLFNVQGACTPPHIATTSQSCFCSDPRLTPFLQGPSGVSSVCTAASCTSTSDLQAIENWYESYCGVKGISASTTTQSGTAATGTNESQSSSAPKSSSNGASETW
jgi:hypothetical protein